MAKIESRSDVRRKVREAQTRAQQERLKRESDNREDMVAFLLAEQKLQAVDDWETEHVAQVRGEAEQRRHEQRVEGAKAVARMKARGETIKDIAALGGVSEKLVRSYLKLAAKTPAVREAAGVGSQALGSAGSAAAESGGRDAVVNGSRALGDRSSSASPDGDGDPGDCVQRSQEDTSHEAVLSANR
ncbi:hypothetical protein AFM11_35155 [Mycolicibacterium wolinskyi]|uniref:Uncharacterized protein n=1 Tax=Mycolicibacterium wolinskyi TaxID=59750 RepID=A0A132PB61_9MYCO|nr:hypothetical protein [Mycolicibacterium wolinskyi]KWX19575.1 hypothetical protein AFM11_35155 [Mycolicibacterium wolinskyi]